MKAGAVPYWACGGEVLTRGLDRSGRLVARHVPADEAQRLIVLHKDGAEAAALRRAVAETLAWRQAAVGASALSP